MTIIEAINRIDALKPNNYTQDDKIGWLSKLDGIIKADIIDTHEGAENIEFKGYDSNTSPSEKLLVPSPYDEMYIKWLEAQIDYANSEIGKYNNSMAMYNSFFGEFEKYYNRHNMPKGTKFKYF